MLTFDLWSQVKFANAVRSNVEKEITSCNFLVPRISCRKFLPLVLSGIHARGWNGSIQVANIAMLTFQWLAFKLWSHGGFANAVRTNVLTFFVGLVYKTFVVRQKALATKPCDKKTRNKKKRYANAYLFSIVNLYSQHYKIIFHLQLELITHIK